jgi:hypothetical protein
MYVFNGNVFNFKEVNTKIISSSVNGNQPLHLKGSEQAHATHGARAYCATAPDRGGGRRAVDKKNFFYNKG